MAAGMYSGTVAATGVSSGGSSCRSSRHNWMKMPHWVDARSFPMQLAVILSRTVSTQLHRQQMNQLSAGYVTRSCVEFSP